MGKAQLAPGPAEPPASERLDSWKEIAVYLKRDTRTVRRWEAREQLPVHRHVHNKQATVYAYSPELDAWWNNRRPRLEPQGQVVPMSRRRLWLVLAIAATAALALGAAWRLKRAPELAFQQRDWVLIASFENRSGKSLFNGTLEYALQQELGNSQFVNVVSRERIDDVLRLMKKPATTTLDSALGREVCLRDGHIKILLTGRIEKLGPTYMLSSLLIDPASGRMLRTVGEQASGQDEVLPAVRRLSNRVRQNLGEEMARIHETEQALEKVTTPSLRALQLYSQAMAFMYQETGNRAAAELLEQALTADPNFASAHILVAHAYSNLGMRKEAAPHYQRALELADTTTDRERYFILGSYYERFLDDSERAIREYEVLVRLYPDHYWGVNNLAVLLESNGRLEEAIPYILTMSELRPNDFLLAYRAWDVLTRFRKDPTSAKQFLERAQRLSTSEDAQAYPEEWTELKSLAVTEHLRRRELGQALIEVDKLAAEIDAHNAPLRDWLAGAVGWGYMELGKLQAAEKFFQVSSLRHLRLARLAEIRGDQKAFRDHMQRFYESGEATGPFVAARLARAGLLSESQKLVSAIPDRGFRQFPQGELAFARGDLDQASRRFRDAFEFFRRYRDGRALLAAEALARALERRGDVSGAIQVLEQGLQENPVPESLSTIVFLQRRLSLLYRKVGREQDAQKAEGELMQLLAYADADHPILVQLKHSQEPSFR